MVQQLMDNAHLAPLPLSVRPIYWEFDHALRLYPMPTAVRSDPSRPSTAGLTRAAVQLILADKFDPYKLQYDDCLVFNPGQFSRKQFSWSTYYPQMVDPKDRMEERCGPSNTSCSFDTTTDFAPREANSRTRNRVVTSRSLIKRRCLL